jgi:hypothetical protein
VLDLLSPPYSPDDGRDCTYYREVAGARAAAAGEPVLLEVYEPPADFVIRESPLPLLLPSLGCNGRACPAIPLLRWLPASGLCS